MLTESVCPYMHIYWEKHGWTKLRWNTSSFILTTCCEIWHRQPGGAEASRAWSRSALGSAWGARLGAVKALHWRPS